MKPVRAMVAWSAGALTALLAAVAWKLVQNSGGTLPRHSWWELLVIAVLAGCLAAGGWRVREQVRTRTRAKREADAAWRSGLDEGEVRAAAAGVMRSSHEGPSADTARRVVVLSQAAAVGGGVLSGWYVGQGLVQLQRLDVPAARDAVVLLGVLSLAGAGLSVLGFVVQRWCTIPDDER